MTGRVLVVGSYRAYEEFLHGQRLPRNTTIYRWACNEHDLRGLGPSTPVLLLHDADPHVMEVARHYFDTVSSYRTPWRSGN